jgi:RHS repeat-associated protein
LVSYVNGGASFVHTDWLGTSRLWNSATYPTYNFQTCTSLPFGDGLNCTSGAPGTLRFTGKERDSESGLDDFGARYNSSQWGRFMSPDPSNVSGSIVDSENPQAWNMYSYVLNNPLNTVDPDGLDYYLLGGDQCGQKVQCDDNGHVLDSNGKAVVITDDRSQTRTD